MQPGAFLLLSCLLLPPPAGGSNPIPDKGKSYNIPYRLTDTAHVLVRVKINGKGPFNYIMDTGAPVTFVSKEVAKKLGLKPDKKGWAVVDRFEVEGGAANTRVKIMVETPFQLEGMNAMNFAGVELHGIIGFDLLARYRLEFDFSKPKMHWTRLDFRPPPPVPLGVKGGAPAGLAAMGSIMKIMGALVGKRPSPELVPAGFLGIEVKEKDGRLLVARVYPQSAAAAADVQAGDQIVEVKGSKVQSLTDMLRQAGQLTPGQRLALRVRRGGDERAITITAGKGL
jgi:hypothetical protein